MTARVSRYTLEPEPHSSHAVILRWPGDGHGRPVLDVGAADGLLGYRLGLEAAAWT